MSQTPKRSGSAAGASSYRASSRFLSKKVLTMKYEETRVAASIKQGARMKQRSVSQIANRHVARCLDKIEAVMELPTICADAIRKEFHWCAEDVAEAHTKQGVEDDTRGNR